VNIHLIIIAFGLLVALIIVLIFGIINFHHKLNLSYDANDDLFSQSIHWMTQAANGHQATALLADELLQQVGGIPGGQVSRMLVEAAYDGNTKQVQDLLD